MDERVIAERDRPTPLDKTVRRVGSGGVNWTKRTLKRPRTAGLITHIYRIER